MFPPHSVITGLDPQFTSLNRRTVKTLKPPLAPRGLSVIVCGDCSPRPSPVSQSVHPSQNPRLLPPVFSSVVRHSKRS